jgi:hypothetical protein
LEEWQEKNYHLHKICEELAENCPDDIERIQSDNLTYEAFADKFELLSKPVIIQGLERECFGEGWKFEVK